MLLAVMLVHTLHAALEDAEAALDPIRVHVTTHVLSRAKFTDS